MLHNASHFALRFIIPSHFLFFYFKTLPTSSPASVLDSESVRCVHGQKKRECPKKVQHFGACFVPSVSSKVPSFPKILISKYSRQCPHPAFSEVTSSQRSLKKGISASPNNGTCCSKERKSRRFVWHPVLVSLLPGSSLLGRIGTLIEVYQVNSTTP